MQRLLVEINQLECIRMEAVVAYFEVLYWNFLGRSEERNDKSPCPGLRGQSADPVSKLQAAVRHRFRTHGVQREVLSFTFAFSFPSLSSTFSPFIVHPFYIFLSSSIFHSFPFLLIDFLILFVSFLLFLSLPLFHSSFSSSPPPPAIPFFFTHSFSFPILSSFLPVLHLLFLIIFCAYFFFLSSLSFVSSSFSSSPSFATQSFLLSFPFPPSLHRSPFPLPSSPPVPTGWAPGPEDSQSLCKVRCYVSN